MTSPRGRAFISNSDLTIRWKARAGNHINGFSVLSRASRALWTHRLTVDFGSTAKGPVL